MPGTKDDFAAAVAKDAVDENIMDTSEVDFVWVIRGFLSYYFPTNHGWKGEDDIVLAVIAHPCLLQRRICQLFMSSLLRSISCLSSLALMVVQCIDKLLELCRNPQCLP